MVKLARACLRHRKIVLGIWLAVLVGAIALSSATGSRYVNNFNLPGKQSQRASDLLKARFPSQSGDRDQIVVATRGAAKLTDPAIRARVQAMVAKVAALPHVTSVTGPYAGAGGARATIDRTGTIGFASLTFDKLANDLPEKAINKVVDTAEAARSGALRVELGGAAIQTVSRVRPAATEAIGVFAAIVVLLITFGSLIAMGLPLLTALFGLGTGLALVAVGSNLFDTANFAPQLAGMIGLGVGIDYALFIVTRFRDAYKDNGGDVEASVLTAMDTAGRAVLFAGATVVIALLGMLLLGVSFLIGPAVASSLAVLCVMIASLTLTPALLGGLGRRVGEKKESRRRRRRRERAEAAGTPVPAPRRARRPEGELWARWAGFVQRHSWACAFAGAAVLVALMIPAFSMHLGQSDAGQDGPSTTTRKAYDLIAKGFGPGISGPLLVAVELPRTGGDRALRKIAAAARATPGIASVTRARLSPDGGVATITAYPSTSPQDRATNRTVQRLRDTVLPPVAKATGATVSVGGLTATLIDLADTFTSKLPLFIGVVVLLSALLLLVVFRSLVIPVQAAAMNLLSIGAALGLVTLVFQDGLGGIEPGPIIAFLPVMMFSIVFGLSMDYEVFLVSRMREEWTRHRDASRAVSDGLAKTGRVVTAAATIMVLVFASFMIGGERVIQMFGLGLASAVFIDAFIIRMLLLPAVLDICGERTWRIPARLDRVLPHMRIEGTEPEAAGSAGAGSGVGAVTDGEREVVGAR